MKKVLTVFLSIALVIAMVPGMVFATGGNAAGGDEQGGVQSNQLVLFNAQRCEVDNDNSISLSNDVEENMTLEDYASTGTSLEPSDSFTVVIAKKNGDSSYTAIVDGIKNNNNDVISIKKTLKGQSAIA